MKLWRSMPNTGLLLSKLGKAKVIEKVKFSPLARRFLLRETKTHARDLFYYYPLSVLGIALELAGIMLVYPFMLALLDSTMIRHFPLLNWLTERLGLSDPVWLNIFLILSIAFLLIGKNAFMAFFHYFQQKKLVDWKTSLSTRLMSSYLKADYLLFLQKTTPDIIRNIALTSVVYDQFFQAIINIVVNATIIAALAITLMFYIPREMAYALTVMLVAVFALHKLRKKAIIQVGKDQVELHKERQKAWQQSIGAIKDTKVLGRESFFISQYEKIEHSYFDRQRHYHFLSVLPPLFMETIMMLSLLALIGVVTASELSHSQALATLGVLVFVMFRMLAPFNRILVGFQLLNLSRESVEIVAGEVEELQTRDATLPVTTARLPFRHSLVFDNVSFRYPHAADYALRNLSCEIPANTFTGITGPSGCGKSTLMGLVLGLMQPTEGEILVDGKPLRGRLMIREWQNNIGFVPQGIFLIDDTVRRNIAFGIADDDVDLERLDWAVEKSQLKEYTDSLPGGLNGPVGENGRNLSVGQRQRLGIARALYLKPSLLAFDEATSSLDVVVERSITESVQALHGQVTVIAIAHRLATLQTCDQIIMMGTGSVLDAGTFEDLAERCEPFQQLLKLSKISTTGSKRETLPLQSKRALRITS